MQHDALALFLHSSLALFFGTLFHHLLDQLRILLCTLSGKSCRNISESLLLGQDRPVGFPNKTTTTTKNPGVGQLPWVSFSAQPGQSSDSPNLLPHKKDFDFSVSFRQYSENTPRSMQKIKEAKNRSFNVQTVKLEGWTSCHYGKFCVDWSLYAYTPAWSSRIDANTVSATL